MKIIETESHKRLSTSRSSVDTRMMNFTKDLESFDSKPEIEQNLYKIFNHSQYSTLNDIKKS